MVVGRVAIAVAVIAVVVAVVIADPIERFDEFKAAADGRASSPTGRWACSAAAAAAAGSSGRRRSTPSRARRSRASARAATGPTGSSTARSRSSPPARTRLLFETVAELGLVGLALIARLLRCRGGAPASGAGAGATLPRARARRWRVLGVGFAAAAVDWTWDLPAVFVPTVIAAALLTGPATLPATGDGGPRRCSARRAAGAASPAASRCCSSPGLSICASGLLLLADHRLDVEPRRGRRGRPRGRDRRGQRRDRPRAVGGRAANPARAALREGRRHSGGAGRDRRGDRALAARLRALPARGPLRRRRRRPGRGRRERSPAPPSSTRSTPSCAAPRVAPAATADATERVSRSRARRSTIRADRRRLLLASSSTIGSSGRRWSSQR